MLSKFSHLFMGGTENFCLSFTQDEKNPTTTTHTCIIFGKIFLLHEGFTSTCIKIKIDFKKHVYYKDGLPILSQYSELNNY